MRSAINRVLSVRPKRDNRPVFVAGSVGLAIALWPTVAWALPGPEVVIPVAAAVGQLLVLSAWMGRHLLRRVRRTKWRWAIVGGFCLASIVVFNLPFTLVALGLFGAFTAKRWSRRCAWGCLLLAVILVSLRTTWPGPLPPVKSYDSTARPVGPFPKTEAQVLRKRPMHLILLGEQEDFANCRPAAGRLVRPADFAAARRSFEECSHPVVILVPPTSNMVDARRTLGRTRPNVHLVLFTQAYPNPPDQGAICYEPPLDFFLRALVPRKWLVKSILSAPIELEQAPWLRPMDVAELVHRRPEVQVVDASWVLRQPTDRMGDLLDGPVVLVHGDVRKLGAAARLLTGQSVRILGLCRLDGSLPGRLERTPLSTTSLWAGMALAVLLVWLLGAVGRFAAFTAEVRFLVGRWSWSARGVLVAGGRFGALAAAALVAWHLGNRAVGPDLAHWVTPTMVGSHALALGTLWLVLLTLGLWLLVAGLPARWRWGAMAVFGVGSIPLFIGLARGPQVLPLHLAVTGIGLIGGALIERAWAAVWAWRARTRGGKCPGWACLEWVAGLDAAGGKARRLADCSRREPQVPPGLVIWTDRNGQVGRRERWVIRLFWGSLPLLVRSTSLEEDRKEATGAGRFESSTCLDPARLEETIKEVVAGYGATSGPLPAVLVMPLVECTRAGVAQDPYIGTQTVLVEESEQRDGVTAGRAGRQHFWGRHSRRWLNQSEATPELEGVARLLERQRASSPRYLEWLARDRVAWLVQSRPAPVGVKADQGDLETSIISAIEPPDRPRQIWLKRAAEGLPPVASVDTAAFWADVWRRDGALGDALALLGVPRILVPRRAMISAWGAAWSISGAVFDIVRLVQLRLLGGLLIPGRSIPRVAGALAYRAAGEAEGFRQTAAYSIALRLLEPFLEEESGAAPPVSPTVLFARALCKAGSVEGVPDRFKHRAQWDLDPACARYGEVGDHRWLPSDQPPRRPMAEPPRVLDKRWCAYFRDCLHDLLVWEVACKRASEPVWGSVQSYAGATPETDQLTLMDVESIGLPLRSETTVGRGIWVSGSGPIQGRADRTMVGPAPGRVLVIDTPTAEVAAHFEGYDAVVAARGGALSHAALVARECGVPALFGVGSGAIVGEGTVRLEEDGRVTWDD